MRRRRLLVPGVTTLLFATAAGCGSPDAAGPSGTSRPTPTLPPGVATDPLIWAEAEEGDDTAPVRQRGSADTTVDVSALAAGQIRVVESQEPGVGDDALRFPAFTEDATYPRAVLVLRNLGVDDALDPGEDDFIWGADVNLDSASSARVDDNGNNVVQRGLSSYPALFKLEVDSDDRPACTVRGTTGTVVVRSAQAVLPGTWYRLQCRRQGDRLTVAVGRVLGDGSATLRFTAREGPVGSIAQDDRDVPLSIGGKVDARGDIIASASDQFNGELANPYLAISRTSSASP